MPNTDLLLYSKRRKQHTKLKRGVLQVNIQLSLSRPNTLKTLVHCEPVLSPELDTLSNHISHSISFLLQTTLNLFFHQIHLDLRDVLLVQ